MNPRGAANEVSTGGSHRKKPGPLAHVSRAEPTGRQRNPVIEVSEKDGMFNVYANFTPIGHSAEAADPTIEFARQGLLITQGTVQRYIPLPSDGEVERATVKNVGGIVRISIPTADLGHRWRSITMR